MVHECLECGRCIAESKEHNGGFEESHGSNEGSFPLVFFLNANVVVSPTNVKFGKQGRFFHVINEFRDERKWIGVLDGMGVQVSIVLARSKGPILLWYKEERGSLGGFRGDYLFSF